MEKISLTDRVRIDKMLLRVKNQRNILYGISKLTGLVTICVETAF
jgi:hypothetical protein